MRTVRDITVFVVATALSVAVIVLVGSRISSLPASGVTPTWHTTASFRPLANVRAVSCAPISTTCVAVGDDGGFVASVIVTNNDGSSWSNASPPPGVTSLSTVSCPSASVCYAGGGSGIMKSIDGGATLDGSRLVISGQSISCFTIPMNAQQLVVPPFSRRLMEQAGFARQLQPGLDSLSSISCPDVNTCLAVGVANSDPSIVGTQDGSTWTTFDQPAVSSLSSISCAKVTSCVASGIAARWRRYIHPAQSTWPLGPLELHSIWNTAELTGLSDRDHLHRALAPTSAQLPT